jgi:hypothetical protein
MPKFADPAMIVINLLCIPVTIPLIALLQSRIAASISFVLQLQQAGLRWLALFGAAAVTLRPAP